jgi:hypothetical protein
VAAHSSQESKFITIIYIFFIPAETFIVSLWITNRFQPVLISADFRKTFGFAAEAVQTIICSQEHAPSVDK